MDAKSLIHDSGKITIRNAAGLVIKDTKLMEAFFELLSYPDIKFSARAARVLYFAAEKDMNSVKPFLSKITKLVLETDNERLLMSLLNLLSIAPLPKSESKYGRLMEKCFKLIDSDTQKASNKIYPLIILERMCQDYPELKHELFLIIKRWMPYSPPSFKCVAGKIMNKLEKEVSIEE